MLVQISQRQPLPANIAVNNWGLYSSKQKPVVHLYYPEYVNFHQPAAINLFGTILLDF